jgi:hypothetical protein
LKNSIITRNDYNKFVKSPLFWSRFRPEAKVLLFNTDTILLRKGIDDYLKYDFISSPLSYNNTGTDPTAKEYLKESYIYSDIIYKDDVISSAGMGIGGGISLRTAGIMYKISKAFADDNNEDESHFFLKHQHSEKYGFKVADRQTSYEFAWERDCPELSILPVVPLSIHAAWIYMNPLIINGLIEKNTIFHSAISATTLPTTKEEIILFFSPEVSTTFSIGTFDGDEEEEEGNGEEKEEVIVKSVAIPKTKPNLKQSSSGDNTHDYQLLWNYIHNNHHNKGNTLSKMNEILETIGVFAFNDLEDCGKEEIEIISSALKPISKKKWIQLMK